MLLTGDINQYNPGVYVYFNLLISALKLLKPYIIIYVVY